MTLDNGLLTNQHLRISPFQFSKASPIRDMLWDCQFKLVCRLSISSLHLTKLSAEIRCRRVLLACREIMCRGTVVRLISPPHTYEIREGKMIRENLSRIVREIETSKEINHLRMNLGTSLSSITLET